MCFCSFITVCIMSLGIVAFLASFCEPDMPDNCVECCAMEFGAKQSFTLLGMGYRSVFKKEQISNVEIFADHCQKVIKAHECYEKCENKFVPWNATILFRFAKHIKMMKPRCEENEAAFNDMNCWNKLSKYENLQEMLFDFDKETKNIFIGKWEPNAPLSEHERNCSAKIDMLEHLVPISRNKCGDMATAMAEYFVKETFLSFAETNNIKELPAKCEELINFQAMPWISKVWAKIFG